MKTSIIHSWEEHDAVHPPEYNRVVSRLANFIRFDLTKKPGDRGEDEASVRAFNRVFVNNEFVEEDIKLVAKFLEALAGRAVETYKLGELNEAPWKEAVVLNAGDAQEAAQKLREVFYAVAPNIKPVADSAPVATP